MQRSRNLCRVQAYGTAILTLALVAGCGHDGPDRLKVWGTVTWKNKPVPSGVIFFSPDSAKGNSGPQGFARIKNGVYDTRFPQSKGCVAGPHIAIVHSGDGQNVGIGHPYGDALCMAYVTPVVIPASGGEINLTIPDTVVAAPHRKDSEE